MRYNNDGAISTAHHILDNGSQSVLQSTDRHSRTTGSQTAIATICSRKGGREAQGLVIDFKYCALNYRPNRKLSYKDTKISCQRYSSLPTSIMWTQKRSSTNYRRRGARAGFRSTYYDGLFQNAIHLRSLIEVGKRILGHHSMHFSLDTIQIVKRSHKQKE